MALSSISTLKPHIPDSSGKLTTQGDVGETKEAMAKGQYNVELQVEPAMAQMPCL